MGGVQSQLQDDSEVVIAYASRSLRLSQRRYCMTRREMLAAVVMHTHFRSYLRGAMDLLDISITSAKGNRYVLVMVDCFSRWTEACPLPDKTAISVADAFFSNIVGVFPDRGRGSADVS